MKSLKRLIRLRKQKVDEQQQYLGTLQDRLNKIQNELTTLHYHLENEQKIATESVEGTLAYVRYAATMQVRIEQIERLYNESLAMYEKEQQKLQELFGELKVLEVFEAEELKRLQKRADQKEQSFLDDLYGSRNSNVS